MIRYLTIKMAIECTFSVTERHINVFWTSGLLFGQKLHTSDIFWLSRNFTCTDNKIAMCITRSTLQLVANHVLVQKSACIMTQKVRKKRKEKRGKKVIKKKGNTGKWGKGKMGK